MPIYEYRCASCGHQQEFLQKVSDAPLTQCPKCSKPSLAKMVTAAGFQLKGSGWYATDFKGKGSGSAKADAKAPADGGEKSSGGEKSTGGDKSSGDKSGDAKSGESKAAAGCGTGCACH